MTTTRLEELGRLLREATPGPWATRSANVFDVVHPLNDREWLSVADAISPKNRGGDLSKAGPDAALIVFLRNHAEDLLAVALAADDLLDFETDAYAIDKKYWTAVHKDAAASLRAALARLSSASEEGS